MRTTLISAALLLLLAWPGSSAAQDEKLTTITPFAGFYLAMSDLVDNQRVPSAGPIDPDNVTITQQSGLAFGVRVSRTLSGRLWLEAEFQYAISDVKISATRREPLPQDTWKGGGRVMTLGANVLWEAYRAPFTPFGIHLVGGLAAVNRSGEFFDEGGFFFDEKLDGGTAIAAVAGLGARYGFSGRFGVRLDVRDYISSYSQSVPSGDFDAVLQNDIWITGGVEITL
ncbi:MAG: outer membrane beta-barrel protein [Gemmatimonadota bacterium]|nr:MAG: outer membrane beta-barrel protein [Gemmatimonadota bacterium]